MLHQAYIASSSVVSLIWGIAWTKKDAFNFLVKLSFFGLAVWGFYILLHR
jgi:hypothetical protein